MEEGTFRGPAAASPSVLMSVPEEGELGPALPLQGTLFSGYMDACPGQRV